MLKILQRHRIRTEAFHLSPTHAEIMEVAADTEPTGPRKHLSQVSYLRKVFDRIMEAGRLFSPRGSNGLCVITGWMVRG